MNLETTLLLLFALQCQVSGDLKVINGSKSETEVDATSIAICPVETVLVKCEVIVGVEGLPHRGARIQDGYCVVTRGSDLEGVSNAQQYVQVRPVCVMFRF